MGLANRLSLARQRLPNPSLLTICKNTIVHLSGLKLPGFSVQGKSVHLMDTSYRFHVKNYNPSLSKYSLQVQPRGVNPQPFQVIEGPGRVKKDMDDHLLVVEEDPLGRFLSFHTPGIDPLFG